MIVLRKTRALILKLFLHLIAHETRRKRMVRETTFAR
jgi:hypothetical protein